MRKTAIALGLICLILTGCARTPLVRTLPEYVRSVYVPMARNTSYEPGLEELVTRAVIEEMLADGRLIVENKRNADATLKIRIKNYVSVTDSYSDDEFPGNNTAIAAADIFVVNNLDGSTIGNFEDIEGRYW